MASKLITQITLDQIKEYGAAVENAALNEKALAFLGVYNCTNGIEFDEQLFVVIQSREESELLGNSNRMRENLSGEFHSMNGKLSVVGRINYHQADFTVYRDFNQEVGVKGEMPAKPQIFSGDRGVNGLYKGTWRMGREGDQGAYLASGNWKMERITADDIPELQDPKDLAELIENLRLVQRGK